MSWKQYSHAISVTSSPAPYWLQFSFAGVTLHYAEFSGNKNISHQKPNLFSDLFLMMVGNNEISVSGLLLRAPALWLLTHPPISRNCLHRGAITTFWETHNFQRNFHAELQKLNAAFLSKRSLPWGHLWIHLCTLMGKGGDDFFSSPTMGWTFPPRNCCFETRPLVPVSG